MYRHFCANYNVLNNIYSYFTKSDQIESSITITFRSMVLFLGFISLLIVFNRYNAYAAWNGNDRSSNVGCQHEAGSLDLSYFSFYLERNSFEFFCLCRQSFS